MNEDYRDRSRPGEAPARRCRSPVLFLVFNRPTITRRVFDAIRNAQPPRVYIAADGPRDNVPNDVARCSETRSILGSIDWPCEVYTRFRVHNLGCRVAVSDAIDWFFEHEPEGIILEDDCLPHDHFFPFCDALLERYRCDSRIVSVGGHGHEFESSDHGESYYFSVYNHCWGWASWRRAWSSFDLNLESWPERRKSKWLQGVGGDHLLFAQYWKRIFDDMHEGKLDTWDYAWTYACWLNNGLSIVPLRNMVSNIGFGLEATHTSNPDDPRSALATRSMDFPLVHPDTITVDRQADRRTGTEFFGITPTRMLVARIKRTTTGRWMMNTARFLARKVGRFAFRRQV